MSNNIKNLKKATHEIFNLTSDSISLITKTAAALPSATVATIQLPFAAGVGYLMESEGLTHSEAEAIAYHILRQDAAKTITQAGEGAGKLLAMAFADEDEDDRLGKAEAEQVAYKIEAALAA